MGNFLINHALRLRYFPHFIFLIGNKLYPILHGFYTDFARQLAYTNPQESHRTGVFRHWNVPCFGNDLYPKNCDTIVSNRGGGGHFTRGPPFPKYVTWSINN